MVWWLIVYQLVLNRLMYPFLSPSHTCASRGYGRAAITQAVGSGTERGIRFSSVLWPRYRSACTWQLVDIVFDRRKFSSCLKISPDSHGQAQIGLTSWWSEGARKLSGESRSEVVNERWCPWCFLESKFCFVLTRPLRMYYELITVSLRCKTDLTTLLLDVISICNGQLDRITILYRISCDVTATLTD